MRAKYRGEKKIKKIFAPAKKQGKVMEMTMDVLHQPVFCRRRYSSATFCASFSKKSENARSEIIESVALHSEICGAIAIPDRIGIAMEHRRVHHFLRSLLYDLQSGAVEIARRQLTGDLSGEQAELLARLVLLLPDSYYTDHHLSAEEARDLRAHCAESLTAIEAFRHGTLRPLAKTKGNKNV